MLILVHLLSVLVTAASLSTGVNDDITIFADNDDSDEDQRRFLGATHYAVEVPAAVRQIESSYHGDAVNVGNGRPVPKSTVDTIVADGSGELKRRRRSKQNLCEHLCTCDLDAKFVTVNCSFLMDKVSQTQLTLPS